MLDRVPVNPGRVLITPENGNAAFYATMTRADNPTQEGTPLNKNTLLKDATAALFGLGTDAVPDDVLAAIKSVLNAHANDIAAGLKIATGSYVGVGGITTVVTLPFAPTLVILYGYSSNYGNQISFFTPSYKFRVSGNSCGRLDTYPQISGNGIVGNTMEGNNQGNTYIYIAFG